MFNFIVFISLFTFYTLFFLINVNWGKNRRIISKVLRSINTWFLLLGILCLIFVLHINIDNNSKTLKCFVNVAYSIIASVIFYFIGIFPTIARKNKQNKKIKDNIIEINKLIGDQFTELMKAFHVNDLNGIGIKLQNQTANVQTLMNYLYQIDIHIGCYDIITFLADDEISNFSLLLSNLKYSVLDLMDNIKLGGINKAPNEIDDSLIEMQKLNKQLSDLIKNN